MHRVCCDVRPPSRLRAVLKRGQCPLSRPAHFRTRQGKTLVRSFHARCRHDRTTSADAVNLADFRDIMHSTALALVPAHAARSRVYKPQHACDRQSILEVTSRSTHNKVFSIHRTTLTMGLNGPPALLCVETGVEYPSEHLKMSAFIANYNSASLPPSPPNHLDYAMDTSPVSYLPLYPIIHLFPDPQCHFSFLSFFRFICRCFPDSPHFPYSHRIQLPIMKSCITCQLSHHFSY